MVKSNIVLFFIFILIPTFSGGTNPIEELVKGGQEMQEAYRNSGAVEAQNTFVNEAMHQVLKSEKSKTVDCEELVNKILSKGENKETENTLSKKNCDQMVDEKLKDMDEDQKSKARPEIEKMCQNLQNSIMQEDEQKAKTKLNEVERCQDLFGKAIKSVDQASEETAKLASPEAQSCIHDYTPLCPQGWNDVGDGDNCEAPASYTGPCSTIERFAKEMEEKKKIEKKCLVYWPCIEECVRDYTSLCPEGWTEIGEGKCLASFSYTGRCETTYNFSQLSAKEKDKWSIACNVNWPCKSPCDRNYSANCPAAWKDSGDGVCDAPTEYIGPCGARQNLNNFSPKMKEIFEKKCNVLFPCKSTCIKDYNSVCPEGWLLVGFQTCSPPDTYTGPCNKNENFENKTDEEKEKFSVECGVLWPCLEECSRDYSEPCPLEWKAEGSYCVAPETYDGPCAKRKKFIDYSNDMKAVTSTQCKVYWPCLNEAIVRPMIEGEGSENHFPFISSKRQRIIRGKSGPIEPGTGLIMGVAI